MDVKFGQGGRELTGPIHDGICVRQSFKAVAEELISVSVYFATYMRQNPGKIFVDIRDTSNATLAEVSVDAGRLEDNSYREFGFGCKLIPGRRYELRIWTQHCRSGESVTAVYSVRPTQDYLFVGRRKVKDGELTCVFNYHGEIEKPKPVQAPAVMRAKEEDVKVLEGTVRGMVSVVIPHMDCQPLLRKCLASLARQTYSCLEVIVVDDGSEKPKMTQLLVDGFRDTFPSIQFVAHEKNRGAPAARNTGAARATGEYLFFCDADVELYPDTLERLVRLLLFNLDVDFAYGGFIWGASRVKPIAFDEMKLKQANYVTSMSLMRRHVFPGWDETLKRHQDWDMWLTIVENGSKGICAGCYLFETPVRSGISTDSNISIPESKRIVKQKHGMAV